MPVVDVFNTNHQSFSDICEGFQALGASGFAVASGAARDRLVAVLEGGYDLDGIAKSTAAVVGRMLGRSKAAAPGAAVRPGLERLLQAYREAHRDHWAVLKE